ncbi:NACHT domain-containing protein [Streptomyces ardesiacus]|uniref:NACHT domain-containing protein n=1 Tax=Streptomyces ardesiacus TaxID=285564 RepID=UPI003F49E1F5
MAGVEIAIGKALATAAARATGAGAAKLAGIPGGALASRWRNRKTRAALTRQTETSISLDLPAETAHSLADYLNSAEFETIALSLVTQIWASAGAKKQGQKFKETRDKLDKSIRLNVRADDVLLEDIIQATWSALMEKGFDNTSKIVAIQGESPLNRAALLKISACFTASDAKYTKALKGIDDLASFHVFENQLRDQVRNLHATMRLPHAGTTRKVPYSRLFVEPQLGVFVKQEREIRNVNVDLQHVLSASHRTVILGDPGGGKSTLSLKLAYDIARSAANAVSAPVPFLFILRDHIDDFKARSLTLIEHLENVCRKPYNIDPPQGGVEYLLNSGRAFVIFDGLDELTDTSLRRGVVDFVESFVHLHPNVPILVTSRRVGYDEAPLDESLFEAVNLADLDKNQVRDYANKWFALDESIEKSRRTELAESFLRDSQFVSDLRRNPLMLSLMCGIYASENYIPANRPDVYKKCAELLFEKWDKQRGIGVSLPFDAHVKHALNSLALWMYSTPKAQHGMKREALIEFVTGFLLEKRFDDEVEAENAATKFVDFCTGRAWVLTDVGSDVTQGIYGFTHRTFLEYFAANQLVRQNSSARALFNRLRSRIAAAEWDVVAQLSLQILGNNVDDGADDFLQLALKEASTRGNTSEARNLISFCGRALAFAVPRPGIIREICESAVAISSIDPTDHATPIDLLNPRGFAPLESIMHASVENIPTVVRFAKEALLSQVEKHPGSERSICQCLFLSYLPELLRSHSGMLSKENMELWQEAQKDMFAAVRKHLKGVSNRSYWASQLRVLLGEIPISESLDRFGVHSVYGVDKDVSQPFVHPFVLSMPGRNAIYSGGSSTYEDSEITRKALIDIGKYLIGKPTPWFTASSELKKLSVPILHSQTVTAAYWDSEELEGVLLMLCPLGELLDEAKVHALGRTYGYVPAMVYKWAAARLDKSLVAGALVTLRSLSLSEEVHAFIEKWIRGSITLADTSDQ